MTKWTQQMPLLMEIEAITTIKAIAYKGELYSEVASKTFTKS